VGATAAWLIGGPITDGLGWEWIFFINVPVAVSVIVLSPALLSESRDQSHGRSFDFAGAATITAALVSLVYAVVEAPGAGWASGQTVGLLGVSLGLIALFAFIETRSEAPLAPLRVFRSRELVGGNAIMFLLGTLAFGMPFILTQYAQEVLHWSAIHFGLTSVVMPVTAAIGSATGQAIATRHGVRWIAAASMALTGLGTLLLSQVSVDGTYFGDIFFGLLVFGPGLGAGYVAGSIASLSGVPESEAGLASGLNNSSFQIGGAVGVAILSSVAVSQAEGAQPLLALTNGLQAAFATAVVFAGLGVLLALLLFAPSRRRTPVPAPDAAVAAAE
jgi:MFS family permease